MTAGPARQVTFLLSDIEGSTHLVRRVGPGYPAMVERHRAILGTAAERHGGRLTPVEGDGCLAFFDSPEQAVAAVDAQRDMHRHDWGASPLRVRVGVHSGQALLHNGEHFGLDLHRAARIADAGHGGQVLVSRATTAWSTCPTGSASATSGITGSATSRRACACSRWSPRGCPRRFRRCGHCRRTRTTCPHRRLRWSAATRRS